MTVLSRHAQKALAGLTRYGSLMMASSRGMVVWRPASKTKGLGLAWQPVRDSESFMPSTIQELSRAGLIVWEAEDRVRLPEEGE